MKIFYRIPLGQNVNRGIRQKQIMNIILLSGGSGKRLWPLSNDIRSKQFIKIFPGEIPDSYESMVQRMYRGIKNIDDRAVITIATSKSQVSTIRNQIGNDVEICIEPCRKDTFPAIVLAAAYLRDVKKIHEDEVVIVCPVDPYVQQDYFQVMKDLETLAYSEKANMVLMGIKPTYPSEKYGYIIPANEKKVSTVLTFKEKPTEMQAQEYIKNGALWNSGVFAFRLGYILRRAHEQIAFRNYYDLWNQYNSLRKISFDYAVVEDEKNLVVMRYVGEWKDLGTWNTLTEAMSEDTVGNVIIGTECVNTHVINELDVPVLCMGLKNLVVSASSQGILVSDKEQSSYIKPYVDEIQQQVMYAEKSWGEFKVIDIEQHSMTIKVTLHAGNAMNYHSHQYRDEVWTVIEGQGRVVLDGKQSAVQTGDVIKIKKGCKHTILADTELKVIEVQIGKNISVGDKKKHLLNKMDERTKR